MILRPLCFRAHSSYFFYANCHRRIRHHRSSLSHITESARPQRAFVRLGVWLRWRWLDIATTEPITISGTSLCLRCAVACRSHESRAWTIVSSDERNAKVVWVAANRRGRMLVFRDATADEPAATRADYAGWKAEALRLYPESEDILHALQSPDELIFTTWRHLSLPYVVSERLLLMGDAAFASSPHLGQGVNLGLLDAWVDVNSRRKTLPCAHRLHP